MKKRIVLGSIIVVLLMLMSSQIVLLNTVKSDPTSHTGDAEVGRLWISELNVESAVDSFDYVGIGRVNATDDWVLWEDGTGNITADWSISTGNNHPEYFVTFDLAICNVDDDNKEIGNDTVTRTITRDQSCVISRGTLKVELQFSEQQMQEYSQTLVCYISTRVQINETTEAVNFSSRADDRAVVAVDFISPMAVPEFSDYVDESNDKYPSMWSWIDGWEREFESEDDMLNFQTYFESESIDAESNPSGNSVWTLGEIGLHMGATGRLGFRYYDVWTREKHWKEYEPGGLIKGVTEIRYNINGNTDIGWFKLRYKLWYEIQYPAHGNWFGKNWGGGDSETGSAKGGIRVYDVGENGEVIITGPLFVFGSGRILPIYVPLSAYSYKIIVDEEGENTLDDDGFNIYWEEACAYYNDTYSVDVSSFTDRGITTVYADIYEVLHSGSSDERIYSFAGDSGDVRVEFTCEV